MSVDMEFPESVKENYRQLRERLRNPVEISEPQGRHIYIFRAGDYIKVGIATDPDVRWRAIASCNPLLEEGGYVTAARYPHAQFIERRIHTELAEFRAKTPSCREWFKYDLDKAVEILKRIIEP